MFISKERLYDLITKVDRLEIDRDRFKSLVKDLRRTVASFDREIEELATKQMYDLRTPLVEVVKALVAETGKEPELVKQVPAKIVLTVQEDET